MGINGFNTSDVQGFLNGRFADMIKVMQDPNVDASSRPEKYESQEKAWGSKGGLPSVWGQKNGAMASGADFLSELVQRAK
ncbi:uncharacterized protein BYT42DRAFT_580389 [Radiomyces spectabilis]|uniref:uncharacterized protein n=1 Tax=Radiomyces spectabilis TaxID=64574 RepID=UPI00221F2A28|nr:uncharacterized protein BYT42DRAFT_580389 [Radiomyces spectabilis]KAI8371476.1 hypothetical protein BYT42DRAFT_580389 [Radiomyces spectabilis]